MNISDTAIRYTVVGIITALLLGLVYASYSGKKQDELIISEQARFSEALQHIQGGQYEQALPLLEQVDIELRNSTMVKYYLGITLASVGEWDRAVQEYQKTLDLNPYKVEDSLFMIQYADVLLNSNKISEARIVLERCQTLPIPEQMPNYKEQVNTLLTQISASSR